MAAEALERMIARLGPDWPAEIAVAVTDPQAPQPPLFAVEEAAVVRAVAGRRAEFTAGRRAARLALARLDLPPAAIPMAEDRTPVWPAGVVGSLSHSAGACIAVVARAGPHRSLGVDLEPYDPLPEDLLPEIGTRTEIAAIGPDPRLAARQLFSAKEAAYKAQYPLSHTLFGFDALRYDGRDRVLRFARPVPPFAEGAVLPVRQWTGEGLCLSLAIL